MALVPLLGKPGTREIPVGKLPSEGDFLQLLHGEIEARGGTVSSREVKDLCCRIKEEKCQNKGGEGTEVESGEALGMDEVHCLARGQPCLMGKMKKGWREAALPMKSDDYNILEQFKKLKQNFDKNKKPQQRAKHSQMADKYNKTTVNMAPSNWEEQIRHDTALTSARREEKINLLADYIGKNSTR